LETFAKQIRTEIVHAIAKKGGGHIGGSLSIADLVAVLYGSALRYRPEEPLWDGRDYLVCSKGHAGPTLYSALALKGFFPKEWLDSLNVGGTNLPGHCDRLKVPGIDATTGSLGQGLSVAAGIAHGLKVQGRAAQNVYCIIGDGESNEGQIWEAAAYAPHYGLSNLIAFLDWNKKQIDGTNEKVMRSGNLEDKFRSFGWYSETIQGNNVEQISNAIKRVKSAKADRPAMLILDTVKGAGIPCIEKRESNHCIGVPPSLYEQCLRELESATAKIKEGIMKSEQY